MKTLIPRIPLACFLLLALAAGPAAAQTSNADLVVSFTNAPAMVSLGQYFTCTVAVQNSGPDVPGNAVVTDWLPGNTTFVAARASRGTWTRAGDAVTWPVGALPRWTPATLALEFKATTTGPRPTWRPSGPTRRIPIRLTTRHRPAAGPGRNPPAIWFTG